VWTLTDTVIDNNKVIYSYWLFALWNLILYLNLYISDTLTLRIWKRDEGGVGVLSYFPYISFYKPIHLSLLDFKII